MGSGWRWRSRCSPHCPPVQRSALALKDVIGLSLEETAATMGTSIAAVKVRSCVRARTSPRPPLRARHGPGRGRRAVAPLRRLFNARDWDALRALFGEETRPRRRFALPSGEGRRRASTSRLTRRSRRARICALEVGFVEGAPALAIFRASSSRPAYFIRIDWRNDRVAQVRDFRYVPYIADEAVFDCP